MRVIPGPEVMSVIARLVLGPESGTKQLGAVQLLPHQRAGAARLTHLLRDPGGALLADDVGLGKTFTALAVAREFRAPLVLAPAALRGMWNDASARTGVAIVFASFESLSSERANPKGHDVVIVDEAHHLRNPATRRFLAAKAACTNARVLLLSATPVQNRTADLRVVLSLFLGERAHAMSLDDIAPLIVRRPEAADAINRPAQDPPQWLRPDEDIDCLDAIVALPSPPAAVDAGDAGTLLVYSLVRQWASSRAALTAALHRRLARTLALEDSLSQGVRPTRAELAAWMHADGVQQLALPLLVSNASAIDGTAWLASVRKHREALRQLLCHASAAAPDPDASRVYRLRELVASNPSRRIVAFSEYAATVEAFFRRLAPTTRVAMLTHAGGRFPHGRVSRPDLLARFRPGGRDAGGERERVDLLLTTDVLSEGVDLHDASIVVHLDLPWNPARLAQRVGRVRRIGSPEASVSVFAMAPPAPAERLLEVERRLRDKLRDASTVTPLVASPLPGVDDSPTVPGVTERLARIYEKWRGTSANPDSPVAGAVRAAVEGALICVRRGGAVEVLACVEGVRNDASSVERLAGSAEPVDVAVDACQIRAAVADATHWLRARDTTDVIDLPARRVAKARAGLLRRADSIARRAPLHARPALSPLLLAARRVATVPLSAGAEDVLDTLAHSPLGDAAWLQAIGQFAAIHSRAPKDEVEVLAVLLLKP